MNADNPSLEKIFRFSSNSINRSNTQSNTLEVYISGAPCGVLSEDKHGAISFTYYRNYKGIPLSLSMPVGLAQYKDRVVRPFLMGLLPDDEIVRSSVCSLMKGARCNDKLISEVLDFTILESFVDQEPEAYAAIKEQLGPNTKKRCKAIEEYILQS
jgi:HipA-like protein